jgi:2-oxoglutarate ferredoxin oxidoreductase subunit alpha
VASCFTLTLRAFDLAERFRTPVFLATDKEMVLGRTTVPVEDLIEIPVRERQMAPPEGTFVPYPEDAPLGVPEMATMGGPHIVRFTTSSHDARGHLTKAPATVGALNDRLARKIEDHLDELEWVQEDLEPRADTLVVSYGTTARASREAVEIARGGGHKVSHLIVESIWPVPEAAILRAATGVAQVVVPELNLGQYRREVERVLGGRAAVLGVNRVDGELITPLEILEAGGLS